MIFNFSENRFESVFKKLFGLFLKLISKHPRLIPPAGATRKSHYTSREGLRRTCVLQSLS